MTADLIPSGNKRDVEQYTQLQLLSLLDTNFAKHKAFESLAI